MLQKKRRILCAALLATVLIFTQMLPAFAGGNASASSVSGTYITGEESGTYVKDPDIENEISTGNFICDTFDSIDRSNALWVRSDALSNSIVPPEGFIVTQALEGGRLKIQNTASGSYDANSQLGYIYSFRSNYRVADIDYVSGDISFAPGAKYGACVAVIWLGETESTVSGIRLSNTSDTGLSMNLIAINKTTGEIKSNSDIGTGRTVTSATGVWHFDVTYTYDYSTAIYKYFFTLSNPEGKYALPLALNAHANFLPYRDLVSRDFGFSVATDVTKGGYVTLDNLTVEFDNGYDEEEEYKTAHAQAIHVQEETISVQDKASIETAVTAYETALPLREKYTLRQVYSRIKSYLPVIENLNAAGKTDTEIVRESNDYSDWNDDFTSVDSLRKWTLFSLFDTQTGGYSSNLSIVYDEDLQKNVMQMFDTSTNYVKPGAVYGAKSYTLPERAVAESVQFKLKVSAEGRGFDENNRFPIYVNYTDANNFEGFDFGYRTKDGTWGYRYIANNNGIRSGYAGFRVVDVDFSKWVDVVITYNGSSVSLNLSQVDEPDRQSSMSATLITGKANPALMPSANYFYSSGLLIADWRMKLNKGTYIEDDTIESPVVYYTGNTVYKSGETVLVSGENLYKTVADIELAQVPDIYDAANAKYVFETNYDKGSAREKSRYFSAADDFSSLTWQRVSVLQWTEDSMKFRIPETFAQNGVYALKINGRNGSESYFYLNNPDIDYAVGDEGEFCTPGGTLQLVGKALAVNMKENAGSNVAVQIRNKNSASDTVILTTAARQITADSEYSIILNIPKSLQKGKYEVSVYNGYGDANAWSEPFAFTVIDPIRDSWGLNTAGESFILDISTLGATGDRQQNATPYFVEALEILAENNGGILYLPEGWYQLQFSIVVPENVRVIGDGHQKTIVYYLPLRWQYYRLPTYAIGFNANVSFEGMTIYATRLSKLFKCFGGANAKNVYFKDIKYYKPTFHGTATSAAEGSGVVLHGYSNWDIHLRIHDEQRNTTAGFWEFPKPINNFHADNFDVEIDGNTSLASYYGSYKFAEIKNCDWKSASFSGMSGSKVIYKNNTYNGIAQALSGNGLYYSGCQFMNVTTNNHEFLVADEGLSWGKDNTGIIKQISDNVYEMRGKQYNAGQAVGLQLCIVSGQGAGQTRIITSNSGMRIQIDNPFEIPPNENSRVILCATRTDHTFYNNLFKNGACGTYFGNVAGTTYDSNRHERHGSFYFWARVSMVNWYVTVKDDSFTEPMYMHTLGDSDQSGQCEIQLRSNGGTNGLKAIMIKNNDLDGYSICGYDGGAPLGQMDYIIEGNYIENVRTAIRMGASKNSTDGMLLHNNIFNHVSVGYANYAALIKTGYNRQTSPLVMILDYTGELAKIKGDVNLDGQVTLKDVTMIRYYLVGTTDLTEVQKQNADVYPDGKVTAKDATVIRNYVLGLLDSLEGIVPDEEPSYEASGSEASSSSGESSSSSSTPSTSGSSSSSSVSSSTSSSSSSSSSAGSSSSAATSSEDSSGWFPGWF